MKKLNNKGIGHHILIIAIVVVAVLGAAGLFVWQRQKNNNIEAKAASYTYLNQFPAPGAGGGWVPMVYWYACKKSTSSGTLVSVIAKSYTKERPTLAVGYGKTKIYSKYMGSTTTYQFPSYVIPTSYKDLTVFNSYGSGSYYTSYQLSWITATC